MPSPFAPLAFVSIAAAQTAAVPTEVRFPVRDSLAVDANVRRGPAGASGPTLVLFHQGGGSARGEYRVITPRLVREGYNVIAADIRGGGDRFGAPEAMQRDEPRKAPAQAARVRVVYLANEGVMLESAAGRVYIDALFGDGLPEYSVVPGPSRDSLERALTGYGGSAVVLTTHAHRDHFDSAAVRRYLGSNPDAVALGPPGTPQRGDSASLDLDWVEVRPVAVPHGPTRRPVGHTGYLVTLGGTTALHVGDTMSEPGTWPALGLPSEGVDIALVPYWYALDDELFRELLNVVGRARVVLLHAPLPAAESEDLKRRGGWSAVSRSLRERHARVRTPSAPGEDVEP